MCWELALRCGLTPRPPQGLPKHSLFKTAISKPKWLKRTLFSRNSLKVCIFTVNLSLGNPTWSKRHPKRHLNDVWATSKPVIGDHMPTSLLSLFCKRIGKGEKSSKAKAEHRFPTQAVLARSRKSNARLQGWKQHVQRLLPFANCRWKCRPLIFLLQLVSTSREWWRFELPSKITSMWHFWDHVSPI